MLPSARCREAFFFPSPLSFIADSMLQQPGGRPVVAGPSPAISLAARDAMQAMCSRKCQLQMARDISDSLAGCRNPAPSLGVCLPSSSFISPLSPRDRLRKSRRHAPLWSLLMLPTGNQSTWQTT
ncbi:unnamed protein product [Periconia digitata]|uniref:Uncharacterized protein n=1 Tax=Periconia digitata TaxID=1303443 RepID=A0A9W4XP94_9PLEO|nr:unnamed protein product [Periconia digitata]